MQNQMMFVIAAAAALIVGWASGWLFQAVVLTAGMAFLMLLWQMRPRSGSLKTEEPEAPPPPAVELANSLSQARRHRQLELERERDALKQELKGAHEALDEVDVRFRERDTLLILVCNELGVDPDSADLLDVVAKRRRESEMAYEIACRNLDDKEELVKQLAEDLRRAMVDNADKIRKMEDQADALKAENDRLVKELDRAAQEAVSMLQNQSERLQKGAEQERQEARGRIAELERELDFLRQELATDEGLVKAAETVEAEDRELAQKLEELTDLMDKMKEDHEAEVNWLQHRVASLEVGLGEACRERDEVRDHFDRVSIELSDELDRTNELRAEIDSLRDRLTENSVVLPPRAPSLARASSPPDLPDDDEQDQVEVDGSQVEVEQDEIQTGLIPRPEDIPLPASFGTDERGEPKLVRPVDEAGPDEPTNTAKNRVVDSVDADEAGDEWGDVPGGWDAPIAIRKGEEEKKK